MISYISGIVIHKDLKYAVIQTSGGVGYKVFSTTDTLVNLHEGNPGTLWVYTAVRENSIDLYGFKDMETLDFFELLLTISGIGPKSALGILGAASVSALREAVSTGETAYLTKISGVGKKVAEKIVLELKGKVGIEKIGAFESSGDIDAIEALKSLGYTHKEAKDALEQIPKDITDTAEKIKSALKNLSR
ncbi:MAG: Holliday junction branch migration protein RuvA [Candidatus Taylorbacteria bacterium]|nr:Holliday junction branch migration protein RuvA [Candidatus Taylorbacteria bacterium]